MITNTLKDKIALIEIPIEIPGNEPESPAVTAAFTQLATAYRERWDQPGARGRSW